MLSNTRNQKWLEYEINLLIIMFNILLKKIPPYPIHDICIESLLKSSQKNTYLVTH